MKIKKILILLIIIYIFFSDIMSSLLQFTLLKTIISLLVVLLFSLYVFLNIRKLKHTRFIFMPLFFITIYLIIWPQIGYLNLFYTIIFGWILAQDFKFSKKVIKLTFLVQFLLILYERVTSTIIYETLISGVINSNKFDYTKSYNLFEITGFRPKGLFPGTLVATSFIIYLVMIYRNNIKMLIGLFVLALLTNGRLALIISGLTLVFKVFKKYDILIINKKLSNIKKSFLLMIPLAFIFLLAFFLLPKLIINNYLDSFDFTSTANAGRIYAYFQSVLLFIDYDFMQKLFGSPNNEVFDVYDRVVASESGFLSMLLDIGVIGLLFYLYYFYKSWLSDNKPLFNFKSKHIGFKFVVLMTFLSFIQYEHINGNVRGTLLWFIIISHTFMNKNIKFNNIEH